MNQEKKKTELMFTYQGFLYYHREMHTFFFWGGEKINLWEYFYTNETNWLFKINVNDVLMNSSVMAQ